MTLFEHILWCYSSRKFGANPTVSSGNGTSADDDRMQVDSLKKGKGEAKCKHHNQEGKRTTNTCSADISRAGDKVEEHTTIPPVTTATLRKARVRRVTRTAKGKANKWTLWKRISLLKQLQQCRIFHKHRVQLENSRAFQTWNRGSWV